MLWYNPIHMNEEIKFPVVAHHRVIVNAEAKDLDAMNRLFATFELTEPISEARASSSGKYASLTLSVRFHDATEMARFDEQLKSVPGLKMVL